MANLNIQRQDKGDRTLLFLAGVLDETSTLNWQQFSHLSNDVSIHLRRLEKINSYGVREWINFVNNIPNGLRVRLEQCSVPFMDQAKRIANFIGSARLHSYLVELYCSECAVEVEHLINISVPAEGRSPVLCPTCQIPMSGDDLVLDTSSGDVDAVAAVADLPFEKTVAAIFAQSITPAALLDARDRLEFVNDEWCQFFRQRREAIVGRPISEVATFSIAGIERPLINEGRQTQRCRRWREVCIRQIPGSLTALETTPFSNDCLLLCLTDISQEATLHQRFRQLWTHANSADGLIESLTAQLEARSQQLIGRDQIIEFIREHLQNAKPELQRLQKLAEESESAHQLSLELVGKLEQFSARMSDMALSKQGESGTHHSFDITDLCAQIQSATLIARRILRIYDSSASADLSN